MGCPRGGVPAFAVHLRPLRDVACTIRRVRRPRAQTSERLRPRRVRGGASIHPPFSNDLSCFAALYSRRRRYWPIKGGTEASQRMETRMATATALKPTTVAPKALPSPNSDFFQFAEMLPAEELAIVKKVR